MISYSIINTASNIGKEYIKNMNDEFDAAVKYVEQQLKSHDIGLEVSKGFMERDQKYTWVGLTPFTGKGNAETIRKLMELPDVTVKRRFHGSDGIYMYHVKFGIRRN